MVRKLSVLVAVLVSAVMILSACAPAAVPAAEAPAAEAPAAEAEAPVEEAPAAEALSGTLTLAGSTTVQPLAEKAGEAFMDMNPDVTIEVQGGGSSVGITAAADGTADIGNASREVKKEELEANPEFQIFTVAKDGIAIVVNPDVTLDNLTKDQIRAIFSGEVTNFNEVGGPDAPITVVAREEGSGTRGAFEEMVMEYKDANGEKVVAPIIANAILQNSNGAVRTTVAETPNSIAFLSFGYLDDSIATVNVEGIEATVENVLNDTYPIARPLNMITNGDPNPVAKAFIDFLLSDAGQAIAVEEGFITVTADASAPAPAAEALSGTLTLAGSTTVQPLAEKAGEAFMDMNPDVTIEVQGGGSSVGITAAADGTADIGNASREVKKEELEANPEFQIFTVAKDGIAIVVNPDVTLDNLTKDQIRAIFSGEVTNFNEVGGPDAPITVVAREEGSGTRGAFEEMVMEYKDANGEKVVAPIIANAILQNSNGAVRTTVAETPNSIAFLSFGYLDDSIATVNVEGIEATVENVLNDTYPIARPLNMITNGDPNPVAKAFIDFLLSDAGQAIAVEEGFITVK